LSSNFPSIVAETVRDIDVIVIRADDLARGMVDVVVQGAWKVGSKVLENRDIRPIAESSHRHAGASGHQYLD
jgi:hypothetical protein